MTCHLPASRCGMSCLAKLKHHTVACIACGLHAMYMYNTQVEQHMWVIAHNDRHCLNHVVVSQYNTAGVCTFLESGSICVGLMSHLQAEACNQRHSQIG